jgi:calcineurin-like phosphoesterase family protein
MFETYLEDVDEAVEQIRNNRYSSVIEHLGGNVYLTVDNNDKTDCCVDIRYRWCSPIDHKMYPTPQGLSLTFEQFDKLKDVAIRYVPQILMSLLSECARDTPSRNRVRWDYIHHNI